MVYELVKADEAFKVDAEIDNLIVMRNFAVYEIGSRLKHIKDSMYFNELGYESFDQYAAAKKMRPSTARAYVHIYEVFIDHFTYTPEELSDTPWYRLQLILPRIKSKSKKEADEWLYKAKELSTSDLKLEMKAEDTGEEYVMEKCPTCGQLSMKKA